MEERQRLRGQDEEEVGEDGEETHRPHQPDQTVGLSHRADLPVAQGEADGDVALDGHAGQV